MNSIGQYLSHIQCDIHKRPIIYFNKDPNANPEDRCQCERCPISSPIHVDLVFQKLDELAPKQELIQSLFNKVKQEWHSLKTKIKNTIEFIFGSYDQVLDDLNQNIGSYSKYFNYRDFITYYQIDDLKKIGQLIYGEKKSNAEQTFMDIYQIPYIKQQLQEQFSNIKTNLILAFDDLKQYLLHQTLKTQSKIMIRTQPKPDSKINQVPQNTGKPPQPPQKSIIIGPGMKFVYEKKFDYKTEGLINCICLNSQGSLLIQGLLPNRIDDPNVVIKQIDSFSKINPLSQSTCGTGEITFVAINETSNILVIADIQQTISCWQNFDSNQWKMIQIIKAHDQKITKLLISQNQLFSASEDKVIKCWQFNNKYVEQYVIQVPTNFENLQINSQGDHLAALSRNEILLWQNQNSLAPITVPEPRSFCFIGDRILIGTAQSMIETYIRDNNSYKQANEPKAMNIGEIKQIIFSDAQRQMVIRTDKKIIIYLYTFQNLMMAQQEITGCYDQVYLQSGKSFSHIILYEEQTPKIHYYVYKK